MSLIEEIFKRKYLIFSIFGVLTILGILGYFTLPKKLFPDIERPHIVVITKYPGADAENVATYITIPLERRLHTLSLVRRISSVSMDSVSSIDVEFEYGKDINSALVEVINELKKVSLPPGASSPFVFKKDSSTPPVIVLAVAPKKNSNLSLADIRELAENQLKDELLKLPHVRNVDIFGGYQKEIEITLNLTTLKKYGLTVKEILDYLSFNNRNIPIGILIDKKNQLTLKLEGQAERIEDFKKMYITPFLKLSDIAQIKVGYSEDFKSLFYSNGRPAIALAVQRLENGDYLKTINEVENLIPKLKKEYPEIDIWIADSMKGITERSFYN
jgi:multidrug efflux pump subunit AcrB